MPYNLFVKKTGEKRYCARNKQTGKTVCYATREKRTRGLKIRERYAAQRRGVREAVSKAYPNEHSGPQHTYSKQRYIRCRRANDEFGSGIDAVYCVRRSDRKSEVQTIRFDAKKYTPAQAKAWLREHDYSTSGFEAATGKGVKEIENKVVREAVWTRRYINDLPDSAFLYIMPGGKKDGEGKTVPRTLRKFPYKDKGGKIDLPHLRNAIARIPQAKGISAATKSRLQTKARRLLERAQ